jgi:predicted phosphodiesterase
MAALTWLHLSDWHQKGADFDRKVVRDALVRDIQDRRSIDPRLADVAFVVFSGDLAHGGKEKEYAAAREHLLDPVLRTTGVGPERLVIVPGNHDMDRDDLELVPAALSEPLSSNEETQKWLTDVKRRSLALEPFSQFRAFVEAYTRQGSPDHANLQRFDVSGRTVAILGLNSAWMCGRRKDAKGEVDEYGHVVVGEPQIHDALDTMRGADVRMVVLHHPFSWLAEWERQRVQERIQHSAHFVLMGHQHVPEVQVLRGTGGDCVVIPAGASYDRRTPGDPTYANAYNWVHLDLDAGRGTVFLRRWSQRRSAWIDDGDAPTGPRFELTLPKDLAPTKRTVSAPRSPEARIEAEANRRAEAEKRYKKLLLETCDIVNLANLPEQDRHLAHRQLELRRLYVPLRAWVETASGKEDDAKLLETIEHRRTTQRRGRDAEGDVPRERQRVPVGERLAAARRLIVLGDPGAGKTTLTRWLATTYLLRLASDPDWKAVPDVGTLPDRDWLPIIVRCRDLDPRSVAGALDDILDHTLRKAELGQAEAAALKDLLRERLHTGRALLLLDGLDEINEPGMRARFCEQLEQIAVAFPEAPVVATSRIVGYREVGYRLGRGFEHLTLADLERGEKDDFARRWCALTELPERRDTAAVELIHDIHSNERIERMTGNPMLLTTLALVKRNLGKLPSRRADLYQAAVEVLLRWRPEIDEPLDPHEAIPQLEYLAYAMCDRGVQRLRRDEVLDLLRRMRVEYPNVYAVHARPPEDFLRRVEARTGLLMESGRVRHLGLEEPVYEFRHLTFQEYLAARALVDGRFHGRDPQKRLDENVALLAGRTEKRQYGEDGPEYRAAQIRRR